MSTAVVPSAVAARVLRADRRGSSWPVVVETSQGLWFTKLRGAAQGAPALIAEIIVAEIARALELHVPAWCIVELPPGVPCDDRNDELRDLLDRSTGDNVGFEFLEGARDLQASEAPTIDPAFAARVLWLDVFVQNIDRSTRNPNIMVRRGRYWLIDHGVALSFHHDWAAVTESSPERPYDVHRHLFGWAADRLPALTELLVPRLTRETLTTAAARVPASLFPETMSADEIDRRRAAYVAFLWKRLRAMSEHLVAASL
ncbi:MAG: HipA family kinase [Gemmatimonadota bacterium]